MGIHATPEAKDHGEIKQYCGTVDSNPNGFTDLKALMLTEFGHFHPNLLHIIQIAPSVTDWPLCIHNPLPAWSKGKIILVGDAAHPVGKNTAHVTATELITIQMLPFGGQGANQAIEDAGALGALFAAVSSPSLVTKRLELFEEVRRLRASRVQILSKTRLGKEKEVEAELRQYADPPEAGKSTIL